MIKSKIEIKAKSRWSLLAELLEVFNVLYAEEDLSLNYSKDLGSFDRGECDACFNLEVDDTELE